jgi:hypothetical protein
MTVTVRIASLLTILISTWIPWTIDAVQASEASNALLAEGRAILFQESMITYADIVAANEKFQQAVAEDTADLNANLFYAVSRIGAFMLRNSAGGIHTLPDLLSLFGAATMPSHPLGDDPFSDLPTLYGDYNPPSTVPGGETVRNFLAGPLVDEIDGSLANLNAVGSGFTLTLSAEETGDRPVEIDDGDILVLQASLQLLKAAALIVTAYDLDVDLRELMVLGNAGVLKIQKMLDLNPDLLKLRSADGAAQLASARASLLTGIDSARAAYDFITAEEDPQDDDLLYFDSYSAQQEALETLVEAEEIKAALAENRTAAFSKTSEWWTLTNGSGDQLKVFFHYISTPPADNFEDLIVQDGSFYAPGGCGFFDRDGLACDGTLESVLRDGNKVTWNLTTGGFLPTTAQFIGTISPQTISGTYTWTSAEGGQSGPFQFSGMRDDLETKTDRIDPNAIFGSASHAPLDIRAALPKFGIHDDAVAGTFPGNANGQVLNGIWPDATTNAQLAKEWDLRHETRLDGNGGPFFNIPPVAAGAISLDGNASDWAGLSNTLVFTDFVGDEEEWADFDSGDIYQVHTAKDETYLYIGIQLNETATPSKAYYWEAMTDYGRDNPWGNLVFGAAHRTDHWEAMLLSQDWSGTKPTTIWTGDGGNVATGAGFIEWRIPLDQLPDQYALSGKWLRVFSMQDYGLVSDDNWTQIQLETTTLSGTISCDGCAGDGRFIIAALPCENPSLCGNEFASSYIDGSGGYTLEGIPIGATVYLFVFYDTDNSGILSFGDILGSSGPVVADGVTGLDVAVDIPVDDSFVMTKPGVYRVFGSDTNPLTTPYYGPWDPNEIDWGEGLTFLGEFSDTATIGTTKFYKYILVLWNGDRCFHFDAIQDLSASTAFRMDEYGNWVGGEWVTSGLVNPGCYEWEEPSNFIGPPDGQVAVTSDYPGFSLMQMPADALDDNAARQLQITLGPAFTFDSRVINLRNIDGTHTFFISDIYDYNGNLPEDIEEWAVTGPGVNFTYTGAQIAAATDGLEFYPEWNEVAILLPGSPQVGPYTFSLTINGSTRTYTDTHHLNRDLPLPDSSKFSVQPNTVLTSKTPMFAWDPITPPGNSGIDGAPIAYRLQILDATTGENVVSTPRTYQMTHYTVPPGKLLPGRTYKYRIRATDSDDWLDVQNRSHSDWVPFSMAATLNHAGAPKFQPDWNALTWTTANGTLLAASVRIFDPEGIASDGASHQVSVTLPDGSSKNLDFDKSIDNQTAYYWGSGPLPPEPAGTYTFEVTDPEDHTATTGDVLTFNPLDPVDAAQIRPSLYNPVQQSIQAVVDNVKVNGQTYDDFNAYPDGSHPKSSLWAWWSDGVNITGQALHLGTPLSVGRANVGVDLKDPAAANAVEAKVTVVSSSSDNGPRARVSGYWFNLDGLDVFAAISVNANRVGYSISKDLNDETFHWEEIDNGTLKTLAPGQTVTVGIDWDGQNLTFKADEATHTYTPTGTILPARYPWKGLQARINLNTSITPTFHWNPVQGAQRYRVRIYNNDNTRTLYRGYEDSGETTTHTVPHGELRPSAYYRFRIEAFDSASTDVDNLSKTPAGNSENFIFYTGIPGDVNNDGFVDMVDVIQALNLMAGDEAVEVSLTADTDADRRIGAAEAMRALQAVAGLR